MSVPSVRASRGGESEEILEEDREELLRRKRKVRFEAVKFTGGETRIAREEKWMQSEDKVPSPKSYRESLMQNVNSRVCWWERSKQDEEIVNEDYGIDTDFAKVLNPSDGISIDVSNSLCPKFLFEEKERERLMKPFGRTLVVKLLGRQSSYGFMVKKLRQIWERKGNIDIFDLDNDFYLVNFQHADDYMEALTGGPWVISDAYLNMARWRPEFNPKNEKIESVIAWVRFPDLPVPLFDKKFLLNLGNVIGKAIKLDIHTAQRARGKFARMCIELDLTKPLVPEFEVDGQVLSVVYESLGMLCNKCGWFGHVKEGCEDFHKKKTEEKMDVEEKGARQKDTDGVEVKRELWQTMQRPRRQRRTNVPIQNQQSGSRFSVLEGVTGGEEKMREEEGGRVSSQKKVQGEGQSREQRNQGKKVSVGEGKRSSMVCNSPGIGAAGHKDRKEREGKVKNVQVRNKERGESSCLKETQNMQNSYECVPESNLELYRSRGVEIFEKENLHPGEQKRKEWNREDMNMRDVFSEGEEEDLIESTGMSIEPEYATLVLADEG